jgi:adenylate kinase
MIRKSADAQRRRPEPGQEEIAEHQFREANDAACQPARR